LAEVPTSVNISLQAPACLNQWPKAISLILLNNKNQSGYFKEQKFIHRQEPVAIYSTEVGTSAELAGEEVKTSITNRNGKQFKIKISD
jgi:hypothetical protein